MKAIDLESKEDQPICFATPFSELNFEIKGPIGSRDMFGVMINMSQTFTLVGSHKINDGGMISLGLLVKKENLIQFFHDLQSDLQTLTRRAG